MQTHSTLLTLHTLMCTRDYVGNAKLSSTFCINDGSQYAAGIGCDPRFAYLLSAWLVDLVTMDHLLLIGTERIW